MWDVITLQNCNFLTTRTRVSELLVTPEILHAVRGQSQGRRKVTVRGGGGSQGSAPTRGDIFKNAHGMIRGEIPKKPKYNGIPHMMHDIAAIAALVTPLTVVK